MRPKKSWVVFAFIPIILALVVEVFHPGAFDKPPFILLNLCFSTQAAYAAPIILLAQTRQSDRDKAHAEADAKHTEELANRHTEDLAANTALTKEVHQLCLLLEGIASKLEVEQ